jgi:lysyl-tRNA synthetase class 2
MQRASFLKLVRTFFYQRGYVELDTPILIKKPGMEPYLDPMLVGSPHLENEGYLITSPEYSHKKALSLGLEKVFEFSHCFRSGEKGDLHTKEFLLLEFYEVGINEYDLMEICKDLILFLQTEFRNLGVPRESIQSITIQELFKRFLGIEPSRDELILYLEQNYGRNDYTRMYYEDLFFLVFLNFIEPKFTSSFFFLHDYPQELAALARVENNHACRFELYFGRVELGNAFYELNSYEEQEKRFIQEQEKRRELGKEVFAIDYEFLESLKTLPDCSGIAIGLDRLFMVFMGKESLKDVSPYYGVID